jgi:superfamily II DNA or RNA helicase
MFRRIRNSFGGSGMSEEKNQSPLQLADLPDTARSDNDVVVETFEIPALLACNRHERVAGWWDILWLDQAKGGLVEFINSGNKMKLLIGVPIKSSLDELVKVEVENRSQASTQLLVDKMKASPDLSKWEQFDLLHWMLNQKQIEIKILIVGYSERDPKAEHAKIQIYYDDDDQIVASSGSKNDTRRGNSGGVDFLVISKSWSSEDSKNQIKGMRDYFESHWKHKDAVCLKDLKDNPIMMEQLKKLGSPDESDLDDKTKFIRRIGEVNLKTTKSLIVNSKNQKYPTNLPKEREDIIIIDAPENITDWHVHTIEECLPSINTIFVAGIDKGKSLSENNLHKHHAFCWEDEGFWSFSKSSHDVVSLSKASKTVELNKLMLEFFNLEALLDDELEPEVSIPGIEEIGDTTKVMASTHPLVPKTISKYPYGGKMFEHHIRALTGESKTDLRRGETAISDGGFLKQKRALFEHATGSGKTGLGLICAGHMLEEVDFVVIVCPKISIANQWWTQVYDWFSTSVNRSQYWAYSLKTDEALILEDTHPTYRTHRLDKSELAILQYDEKAILVCVQNTFLHEDTIKHLQELEKSGKSWGIIIDEAHRFIQNDKTSINELQKLNPVWRLALTASFDNRKNVEGTTEILNWITPEQKRDTYPLSSALSDELLKPFKVRLHQIKCDFEDDSFKQASQSYVVNNISKLIESGPTILFVNEQSVDELRSLNEKIRLKGADPSYYTYNHQGLKLLERWRKGNVNPMSSLTILDEGVDVSECSGAIMLDSSENDNRQWIQRRGRTLRLGGSSEAIIHDFIPPFDIGNKWSVDWWRRNSARLEELMRDSLSSEQKVKDMKYLGANSSVLGDLHG